MGGTLGDFANYCFNYWMTNKRTFRCPFPRDIHKELKKKTTEEFAAWYLSLEETARKNLTSSDLWQNFERIIKNIGISLAKTEDQVLTIQYPHLPRTGDIFHDHDADPDHEHMNKIIARDIVIHGKKKYLQVKYKEPDIEGKTETLFELTHE